MPAVRRDVHRDAMLLIGLAVGVLTAAGRFAKPVDAVSYWLAGSSSDLYPTSWGDWAGGAYLFYPPIVAQVFTLLQPLGWQLFIVGFTVVTFGAMWYCCREWSIPLLLIGIPYYVTGNGWLGYPATFLSYALLGNLQWILAAAAAAVLRHPSLWPVLVLSKMTTGVGWWWHVARREWRPAATGAGLTIALVALSFASWPAAWSDFANFTVNNAGMGDAPIPLFPIPLVVRLPMALALVVWGARTERPWVVPVATGWAVPAIYGLGFLPFWVSPARELISRAKAGRAPATAH